MMIALWRIKGDSGNGNPESTYHKLLVRLCHTFCQAAEQNLETDLLSECPDPTVAMKVHPFLKSSRMKGNRTLELSLVTRFQARGSGFVSTKDSHLKDLGVLHKDSTLGSRTSSEYACRILHKTTRHMEEAVQKSKHINVAFDAASVSEENDPR